MTESADQPLLEALAEDAPKKKATKRRTTVAAGAKTRSTKASSKKKVETPAEELPPVAEPAEVENEKAEAPKKAKASKARAPKKTTAKKKAATEDPEVDANDGTHPELATEKPVNAETAAAPVPPQPAARKYPVYIPRTVAKQLEAEGKQVGVAVTASEELPPELMEKIAAASTPASSAQRAPRPSALPPEIQAQPPTPQRPSPAAANALPPELTAPAAPVVESEPRPEELFESEGLIEISGKGFGFIRGAKHSFAQTPSDIFVTPEIVKSYHLRDGQMLRGIVRRGPRGSQLHKLTHINGAPADEVKNLPAFDELTVISPEPRVTLETVPDRYTTRMIDLLCPIGRGQRGLIVAPPRTGKTTLLAHIADAVLKNHKDIHLMFLLIDERPEEVTDIKRSVPGAEVFASSNDLDTKSHTRMAQLAIERAKRLVEQGRHVFILLDSITRVGRAFNNATTGGGRTGSGGLDNRALEIPRRLFAAARNTEEGGSLTIVATALIETNSRMDEVIFQEFKGTGNMELVLDRKISEQRVYPAMDIFMSGTRREELLIPEADLHKIHVIRRGLAGYKPLEAVERMLFFMKKFPTNAQMLAGIPG
jgi:transcription termination factor Rho